MCPSVELRPGETRPELSGSEIDAKINADRPRWNQHADALRVASLNALKMVKARNPEGILDAGTAIDKACESCHLEYWYPGDRAGRPGRSGQEGHVRPAEEEIGRSTHSAPA